MVRTANGLDISILVFLLMVLSVNNVLSNPTALTYSNALKIGDEYSWKVSENIKNGKTVDKGDFKSGTVITIKIIGNITSYNHYTLQADAQLYDIFEMRINGKYFSPLFAMDFIIPVVLGYPNGTMQNLLEVNNAKIIVEDENKIKTSRQIINGEYRNIIETFWQNGTVKFIVENRYQVGTGLLNLLNVENENSKFTIEKDGYPANNSNFFSQISLSSYTLIVGLLISTAFLTVKRLKKNNNISDKRI